MISDDKIRKGGRYIDKGWRFELSGPVQSAWSLYSGVGEGRTIDFV